MLRRERDGFLFNWVLKRDNFDAISASFFFILAASAAFCSFKSALSLALVAASAADSVAAHFSLFALCAFQCDLPDQYY